MDVRNKQKPKKRRTRRILDDLRRRSRREVKSHTKIIKENSRAFNNMSKHNELITCNRLTLTLFNKAIRSKTVTRLPFSKIEKTDHISNEAINKFITECSPQSLTPASTFNSICKNNVSLENPALFKKHPDNESDPDSGSTSCSSQNGSINTEVNSQLGNYKYKYSSNFTSGSNSETESPHCIYEKFMQELPAYLKKHFPAYTSSFLNENVVYLKQKYLENICQEKESISWKRNEPNINILENLRGSILQKPMDYIQTGLLWERSMKENQNLLLSNGSTSSLSECRSTISDTNCLNSPEYQYYPHKLNQ